MSRALAERRQKVRRKTDLRCKGEAKGCYSVGWLVFHEEDCPVAKGF